jgi:hypothetical protein
VAKTSDNTPAPDSEAEPTDGVVGKGQPTPSRKEREAANKRPLVPGDRKAANKEARAKMAEAREKARIGIANGDERYLPERDRGPQKRYVRDYVDARTGIGEFMIPVMFLVIIITFVPDPSTQVIAMLTLWLFFGLAVIDSVILGFLVRRKLRAKFGEDRVERGVRWYAAMRSLQLRVMRLPKPQVKRGHFPK